MAVYSHSKLAMFEQCRYKYKLKYVDKVPQPIRGTIEAHLGSCVHDALEWIYQKVLTGEEPRLDALIEKYFATWEKNYDDGLLVVKRDRNVKDYFNQGIRFLTDYYTKHKPFKDGTIATEKRISMKISPEHSIVGFIDRLVYNGETGEYEIHDYKTANALPPREKFETDRQLALYSIAIKNEYANRPVLLVWHYLNFNMKISSRRTDAELQNLIDEILELISKIENATEFPHEKSVLCDWCEYKPYCKAWGNVLPEEFQKKV